MNIEVDFQFEPAEPDAGLREGWIVEAVIKDEGIEHVIGVVPDLGPAEEWDVCDVSSDLIRGDERTLTTSIYDKVEKVGEIPEIVAPLQRRWDEIQEEERKADAELARAYEEEQAYYAERESQAREDEAECLASDEGGWAHDDPPLNADYRGPGREESGL